MPLQLPSTEIFLRSPYWITVNESQLDYVVCELRIWTGAMGDEPIYSDIKIRSTALNDSTSIDIAEFARDFVEVRFEGTYESNAVFISYELTKILQGQTSAPSPEAKVYLTGLDGYGTFQDGVNFAWANEVMISDPVVTAYPEEAIEIPVMQTNLTGYSLQRFAAGYGGAYSTFHSVTSLAPTDNSANMIRYVNSRFGGVLADKILFHFDGIADETVLINYGDCNKFGLTRLSFVNRLGCIQTMHYFGRFDVKMSQKGNTYKRNLLSSGNYDATRHQDYTLNKNGRITMSLNTGWRSEEENDSMIEMLMSEQIWIGVDSLKLGNGWVPKQSSLWIVPVTVKNSNLEIKNRLNDKMINYSLDFEAAQDWINSVR